MGPQEWGGEGRTINMPISTDGSGMPTTRPQTGSPGQGLGEGGRKDEWGNLEFEEGLKVRKQGVYEIQP